MSRIWTDVPTALAMFDEWMEEQAASATAPPLPPPFPQAVQENEQGF